MPTSEAGGLRGAVEALAAEWTNAARVNVPSAGVDHVGAAFAAARLRALLAAHPAPEADPTAGEREGTCPECGHQWSPDGCTGDPTPSDVWAGVSPSACDCPCPVPATPDAGDARCPGCGYVECPRPRSHPASLECDWEPDAGDASTIAGHVMACHSQRDRDEWRCICPATEVTRAEQ